MVWNMPRGITFFFLVAVWALHCAAGDPGGDESKLQFRALSFPELIFTTADTSNRDGIRKPMPGVRLLRNSLPAEYDFTELLKSYGVSFPPGSLAIYGCGVLILRNTPENLDLAARIFQGSDLSNSRVSMELSTYECTVAPGQDLLPWKQLTWSDLQHLPGGAVKLTSSTSLLAAGGTRNVTSNVTAPAPPDYQLELPQKKTGGDLTFQRGETGSSLDVEMLGESVGLKYLSRTPPAGRENEIAKVSLINFFTAWDDYPLIVQAASAGDQPGKYSVTAARITASYLKPWKFPPAKFPLSAVGETAQASAKPIPDGMDMAVFWASNLSGSIVEKPLDTLKSVGVSFPEGSLAVFDQPSKRLIVINTPQNLELINLVISSGLMGDRFVAVELSAYEFSPPEAIRAQGLDQFTFQNLQDLPRDQVKSLGYVLLFTKNGMPSKSARITSPVAPDRPKSMTPQEAWKFQPGETGMILEATPSLSVPPVPAAGNVVKISLDVVYTLRLPGKKAGDETEQVKLDTAADLLNDEPAILRIVPSENEEDRYIAIVARAKWVNEGGWKLPR